MAKVLEDLTREIRRCEVCRGSLPLDPRPIVSIGAKSKILIIGQAPGLAAHQTSTPWNDKSGDNLRRWMDIDKSIFYDTGKISIMPMGFCYPGKGRSGDLPPRHECAPLWHSQVMKNLPDIQLTLLIGKYAQNGYLNHYKNARLTEIVKNARHFLPRFFPLPHPSPRNNIWMMKNGWFEKDILPLLKSQVRDLLR